MNGVLAALLSQKGYTVTEEVLEGQFAFCRCFYGSDGYDLDKMTENLGKTYKFLIQESELNSASITLVSNGNHFLN